MKSLIAFSLLALFIAGCQRAGLSPNETRDINYATCIMSLYDNPTSQTTLQPLSLPTRLAVAQVGEITPPAALLASLRADPAFSRVEPVPGLFNDSAPYDANRQARIQAEIKTQVDRMRRYSSDLGMTHLFLFGGSIDYDTHSNPLSVLDWTIIGAYVVPGKNVKAQGRAAGALIDLSTGRVLFVVTAEAQKERLASTATSDGQEQNILAAMRDDMITDLGQKLSTQSRQHAGLALPNPTYLQPQPTQPAAGWRPAN